MTTEHPPGGVSALTARDQEAIARTLTPLLAGFSERNVDELADVYTDDAETDAVEVQGPRAGRPGASSASPGPRSWCARSPCEGCANRPGASRARWRPPRCRSQRPGRPNLRRAHGVRSPSYGG